MIHWCTRFDSAHTLFTLFNASSSCSTFQAEAVGPHCRFTSLWPFARCVPEAQSLSSQAGSWWDSQNVRASSQPASTSDLPTEDLGCVRLWTKHEGLGRTHQQEGAAALSENVIGEDVIARCANMEAKFQKELHGVTANNALLTTSMLPLRDVQLWVRHRQQLRPSVPKSPW
jgi:hypothetical protein